MTIVIDQQKCTGCGLCAAICPRAFCIDETGVKAKAIDTAASGADVDEAAMSCPARAIEQSAS